MESQVLEQRIHESEARLAEFEKKVVEQIPAKERQIGQLQLALAGHTNRIRELEAVLAAREQKAGELEAALAEARSNLEARVAAPAPEPVVVDLLDELHLRSGTAVVCRVRSYEEGYLTVQIGDGVKRARLADVDRFSLRTVHPTSNTDTMPAVALTSTNPAPIIDPTGAPAYVPPKGVVLSPRWRSSPRYSTSISDLVRGWFKRVGTPELDLEPKVGVLIRPNMPYLVPIAQALKVPSEKMPSRNAVDCPVFPAESFFYYKFEGAYEGGCSEMLVLTDIEDKIVGVQFGDDSPRGMRFEQGQHSGSVALFNILEYKRKASRDWKVAVGVQQTNQVVRIDLELVSPESGSEYRDRPREFNRLYLPQPMVNTLLYVAAQN
jgi:hypothetical protein